MIPYYVDQDLICTYVASSRSCVTYRSYGYTKYNHELLGLAVVSAVVYQYI